MNNLNNLGRLWAVGVVPNFLVPGLGVILGRGVIDLVCENLIKEMVRGVDSELVGLFIKGLLPGKSFAVFGN